MQQICSTNGNLGLMGPKPGVSAIDGILIRELRRRLGLTQGQLADRLQVDQGTVSRWERGLEDPRPARRAELQNLLLRDESRRAMRRGLAMVRQDYLPSSLLDSRLRLQEISASGKRYFSGLGKDPDALIGMDFDRYCGRIGATQLYEQLAASGLLSGDALLFRFVVNNGGRAHATVYEPIFESGALVGILNYLTARFDLPSDGGRSVELIEVVRTDDPSRAIPLHRGVQAEAACAALRLT